MSFYFAIGLKVQLFGCIILQKVKKNPWAKSKTCGGDLNSKTHRETCPTSIPYSGLKMKIEILSK
jgi:hypothetical protein